MIGATGASHPRLRELLPPLLLMAVALVIRLVDLGGESLWIDEGYTLRDAEHSRLLGSIRPLFFLLIHWWMKLGSSDVWLRLPAVAFGVASVGLLWFLARALAGRSVAWAACLLVAVAVPQVEHSQEVRMYTLTAFLVVAALVVLQRWDGRAVAPAFAHGLLCWLAMLATPVAAMALLPGIAVVLASRWPRFGRLPVLAAAYGTAFAAWLPFATRVGRAVEHIGGERGWMDPPTLRSWAGLAGNLLAAHAGFPGRAAFSWFLHAGLGFSCLVLLAIAVVRPPSAIRRVGRALVLALAGTSGALFVFSLVSHRVFLPRYFTAGTPLLCVALAIGLVAAWSWRRLVAVILGGVLFSVMLISLVAYYRVPTREDWRGAALWLKGEAGAADAVVVAGPNAALWRHYFGTALPIREVNIRNDSGGSITAGELLASVPPEQRGGRVWLVVRLSGNVRASKLLSELHALCALPEAGAKCGGSFRMLVIGFPPGWRPPAT